MQQQVRGSQPLENAEQLGAQLEQLAQRLQQHQQEIQQLHLADPQLQTFQQQLITSYQIALNNTKALRQSIQGNNLQRAQAALNAFNVASGKEAVLWKAICNYCQSESVPK